MWDTEIPASRTYSTFPNTSCSRCITRRTAGPDSSSCAASTPASRAMSAAVYRRGKLGRQAGLRLTRLVFIQRQIHRVNCARLSPVIFTRKRRTIPFWPRPKRRYCCDFKTRSMNSYTASRFGAEKPMVRLPSTNSRIWPNVSRSMFCMVIFIHPQHCTLFSAPSIQAHLALETTYPSRLIPRWIILGLDCAGWQALLSGPHSLSAVRVYDSAADQHVEYSVDWFSDCEHRAYGAL